MTTLKDNLAKVKAGKLTGKHQTSQRKPRKGNGRAVAGCKIDRKQFCRELIKAGMDATVAYKAVSPRVTHATARANGSRLLADANTTKILQPMLARLFSKAGIEADYVFRRWCEMAEASPLDYFTIDDLGTPRLDMSDLTPAQRTNLKEVTITPTQHGDKITVKVVNQQRAIEMIAKHLGLLVDRLADEDVERIGDVIERGISRIKKSRDLDGWKDIVHDAEFTEVR